jgi:adenylate kinase
VIWLVAIGGVLVGLVTGWGATTVTYRVRKADSIAARPEEVAKFMARVVNLEALEEHRRLVRLKMMQAGRRTVRYDGGKPATVHTMRRRRRITNRRDDTS